MPKLIQPFVFLLGLALTLSACGNLWEPKQTAEVTLRFPKKHASMRAAAEASEQEWVRVSVRGPGMTPIQQTALAGERILLEVPAGGARVFSAELFADEALQQKTYGGESKPTELSPGKAVTVVIEVRRVDENAAPSIAAATIAQGQYYETSTLQVDVSGWTDADGDQPRYKYAWLVNGSEVAGLNGPTITGQHFSKGDKVACRVTPIDDQSEGKPVVSNDAVILNSPPAIQLALPAGPFYASSQIAPQFQAVDADGDSLTTAFQWTVDGNPVTTETAVLPSYRASKGQTVVFTVTSSDGTDTVTAAAQPAVILNALPHLDSKTLNTAAPRESSTLAIAVSYGDIDGDDVLPSFQWYVNGVPVVGATTQSITGADFNRGDAVKVAISLSDGTDINTFESDTVVVANTPPSAAFASLEGGPFYEASTVVASVTGWADDDGDLPAYEYTWKVDGFAVAHTGQTLDGAYFNKGNSVFAEVTPFDGFDYGATITSATQVITNTAPSITSLYWASGSFPLFTTNNAEYVATTFDADGDPVTTATVWEINSIVFGGETSQSLSHGYFVKGDVITVTVTPYDGTTAGAPQTESITVLNSPPSEPAITIGPLSGSLLVEGDGGHLQWTLDVVSVDPDGDSITYEGDWYRNGVYVVTSPGMLTSSMLQDEGLAFVAGDAWHVEVSAHDSTGLEGRSKKVASNTIKVAGAAAKVSVGGQTTCAVTVSNKLYCWGMGPVGQTNNYKPFAPEPVAGFAADASEVSVGRDHACAITLGGELKCWGGNNYGQLGTGNFDYSNEPVMASGITGVVQVAAGEYHTCARTIAGGIYCWGEGAQGRIGVGDESVNFNIPQLVEFGEPVSWVTAGAFHSCAVGISGQAKCWGSDGYQQLGGGGMGNALTPIAVSGLTNALKIEAGRLHTCALLTDGGVSCWGAGYEGQNGTPTGSPASTPYLITALFGTAVDIDAGEAHSCAVMLDSTVYCWGSNASGSLGLGNATFSYGPQLVQMPSTFMPPEMVSTGDDATCLITQGGGLLCWGRNNGGKLGNGTSHDAVPPTTTSVSGVTGIATGELHVCTLGVDVMCWGYNSYGQLGSGGWAEAVWQPIITGAGSGAPLYVRAGGFNTCTVRDDATLWCSGSNVDGQAGNGTVGGGHVYAPTKVSGLDEGVVDASLSRDFACAITVDAGVKCWGKNTVGQLGIGFTSANVTYPTEVPIGIPVLSVAAGFDHACAVDSNGSVWCWGSNTNGQLGDGTTNGRPTPAQVVGLSNVTKVVAGRYSTCALDGSNNVFCWGDYMTTAQPGLDNKLTPQQISGYQAIDIELGSQHACLVSTTGNVHCWGASSNFELGVTPGGGDSRMPQAAVPVGAPVTAISLGAAFTCVVTSEQNVVCWGENDYGQINDTTTWLPNGVLEMYDDVGGY